MNAAQLLENTLQADANVREAATKQLEAAAQDNFHGYLHTLAAELANEQSAPHIRRAAGLAFKNALAARDQANQGSLSERYLSLPDDATAPLKQSLLSTLGSPQHAAGSVAAQCISAVAAIELPVGKWPELIGLLLEFVQNQDNVGLRISTLQAVGYICEVIRPDILAARSNEILTAVVQGARKEEPSMEVQSAAIHSLYNSLEFIRDNFEREGERNYIMQVVCEATQSPSPAVQVGAFECLVRIMGLYYSKMDFYMERALFGLTTMGMRHPEEPVVLQAIEFWSTVCEEEIEINQEAQEAAMYGETPAIESKGFAKMALSEILPTLLGLLSDQNEDDDEDDWTKSMAAASCLELLARNVGDAIVQPVVPFVEQGISQADWQHREAAVMAFGSIIDGPEPSTLAPLVTQAFGALIGMMTSDPSPQVRDTVAWTLGRICEIMLETIDPSVHIDNLVGALLGGLGTTPRIASSCCHALTQLVNQINMPHAGDLIPTSPLSPLYPNVFQALMPLSEKGTNESSSRTAAYTTIGAFVASSAADTLPLVHEVFIAMLSRQEALLGMHAQLVGSDDRQNWNDMQVNICVVIQSVILKSPEMVSSQADRIMQNLLQIISTAGKGSGVLEDAFATVGTLARESKSGFDKYLEAFNPFLLQALNSYEDWQVCQAAVYVVSDVASAVGPLWTGQAEPIMVALIEILRSPVIHRSVKPNAITAIGDLALAIGSAFVPYLQGTMDILSQAGSTTAPVDDIAMLDFVWQMREAIVDTFTSILSGIKDQQSDAFKPYVNGIVGFLRNCWIDDDKTDAFAASMINLLGDFGDTYRRDVRDALMQEWVQDAVNYGRSGKGNRSAKDGAAYLQSAIKEISK